MAKTEKIINFPINDFNSTPITVVTDESGKITLIPEDGYKLYPMKTSYEQVFLHHYPKELVGYRKFGSVSHLAVLVPVKTRAYEILQRDDWKEAKRNESSRRCTITSPKTGHAIKCDKACKECPYAGRLTNEVQTTTDSSLDAMYEASEFEPGSHLGTPEDSRELLLDEEVEEALYEANPVFLEIYYAIKHGFKGKEIMKKLNIPTSTYYDYFDKLKGIMTDLLRY